MHQLIEGTFRSAFDNPWLNEQGDAAVLNVNESRLAFTTDSFVVQPLEFPGGDIGRLAVFGTVNDLAMAGARPLHLSAGFILEEGLPLATLNRIVASMRDAAEEAGVTIVTGDTKVVDRGKADGLFINTAGVGVVQHGLALGPAAMQPGDAVLVNGDLGRHGIAVMACREGLAFETPLESDCAPLAAPVAALLDAGVQVRCLRDLTRGGLASAVNELCGGRAGMRLIESRIPVEEAVRGACELLGLDPLYVANEGRFIAVVAPEDAGRALDLLASHAAGAAPAHIGHITATPGRVLLESPIGAERILDLLSGEQLPRIC